MQFGFWDWLLLVATLLGLVIYYYWRKNQYFKNLNINYVTPQLIMGNMSSVIFQKHHILDVLQNAYYKFSEDRYIGIFIFTNPIVMICDPELIKIVMVKDFDHFVDHGFDAGFNEDLNPLFAKMLLNLKGDRWRKMRNTLTPAFTSSKMRAMLPLMQESIGNMVEYLKMQTDNLEGQGKDYIDLEVNDLYTRYTNDVIASCAFGVKTNSVKDKENMFYNMAKDFTSFGLTDFAKSCLFALSPALMKFSKMNIGKPHVDNFFRNLVTTNMKDRETHDTVRHDMIHLLMLAKQDKLHDDFPASENGDLLHPDLNKKLKKTDWTDDDITAQVLLFLFAGFESSANFVSFMTYELTVNPDVQKKLQEEIDESLARTGGVVDYNEIHNLKYLDMVISETLRLWPGFNNIDRVCIKPYQFPPQNDTRKGSIKLKNGDRVWIPTYSLHRDPRHFTNPNTFDPERFSDENKSSIKPYTYLPFGAGPRQCLGLRFALMEAKVLAVNLFSKFEFTRTRKTQVPMKLLNHIFSITAENGFHLGVRQRKKL